MQEAGFCCGGGFYDVLEVAGRVASYFLFCVAVTYTGDEDGGVDD